MDKVHSIFKYDQFDDILEEYLALKKEFEGGENAAARENEGEPSRRVLIESAEEKREEEKTNL